MTSLGAYGWASELLGCLCEQLEDRPVCFCGIITGASLVHQDACLCNGAGGVCGSAWVRLVGAYPSTTFPNPDASSTACQAAMAYQFQLGVSRCIPGIDPTTKRVPTAADLLPAASDMMADLEATHAAVVCCLTADKSRKISYLLGAWIPTGPQGNCAGGVWPVTIWDFI